MEEMFSTFKHEHFTSNEVGIGDWIKFEERMAAVDDNWDCEAAMIETAIVQMRALGISETIVSQIDEKLREMKAVQVESIITGMLERETPAVREEAPAPESDWQQVRGRRKKGLRVAPRSRAEGSAMAPVAPTTGAREAPFSAFELDRMAAMVRQMDEAMAPVARTTGAREAPSHGADCIVCMESEATCALIPCGHQHFCAACATQYIGKPCPTCRTTASAQLRVFR
jgi:DNA-binding transcriptional regulator YdaS (Cro superfamily)